MLGHHRYPKSPISFCNEAKTKDMLINLLLVVVVVAAAAAAAAAKATAVVVVYFIISLS